MTAIDLFAGSQYLNVRRLLVCGSRTVTREQLPLIRAELACVPKNCVVIHGAADGADKLAEEVALGLGLKVEAFPALWYAHGDRAGKLRNLQMLDTKPNMVLAFWDGRSPGTGHTVSNARKRGIPVRVVGV